MMEPFELFTDSQARLVLRRPGKDDVTDVRLRRAVPWSKSSGFVSVRDAEEVRIEAIDAVEKAAPAGRDLARDGRVGIVERR